MMKLIFTSTDPRLGGLRVVCTRRTHGFMLNVDGSSASLADLNALALLLPGLPTASLLPPVTRMILALLMPLLQESMVYSAATLSTVASLETYAVLAGDGRNQSRLAKGIVEVQTASRSEYQCQ
jgi:hypothetical protein